MKLTQCIEPRQGDWFHIYIVKCDGMTENIFTHKTQAEAYIRECAKVYPAAHWNILSYDTIPHDNHV